MGGGEDTPPSQSIITLAATSNSNNTSPPHPDLKGTLLLAWPLPKPTTILERIQTRYPNLTITFLDPTKEKPTDDLFRKATFLSTFSTLPSTPAKLPNCDFIHICSAGINHLVSHPIFTDSTIPLTTSSGIHAPTIAEWVLLSLLSSTHRFPLLLSWHSAGHWTPSRIAGPALSSVRDLASQTVAVYGYGSIGRQVARAARGVGMDVIAYTARAKTTPEARRDEGYIVPGTGDPEGILPQAWFSGTSKKELHAFLGQEFDVLVICVPLTNATRYVLGEDEFAILGRKEGRRPMVVNIARGQVIVQSALVAQLHAYTDSHGEHGIRAAALDVTDPEPLPDGDELWRVENCFVSPHVSAYSEAMGERCAEVLEGNLERWRTGEKLWNEVDRGRGY